MRLGLVEDDISRLYDNWFIETCQEWVVPYIGDLLGVQGLYPIQAAGFTQRAYVVQHIAYRRRKARRLCWSSYPRCDRLACRGGRVL
ncbi:MAG: hypothetical protein IPM84_20320 [Anaerolineae bacterium]|nr:hypothetical protein [Anaerolineae bacterium]